MQILDSHHRLRTRHARGRLALGLIQTVTIRDALIMA